MDILIFKTNLCGYDDREKIAPAFLDDERISRWNIDHEDCDNVLRIEAKNLCASEVIERVTNAGYICEELPD